MDARFKNINILVVDDHFIMRKTVKDMLRMLGYQNVMMAENGAEAFRLIEESFGEKKPIHLLITDWAMPGGLGIELVHRVKNSPQYYRIPTIMITGETLKHQISQAIEYGADGYLLKPFKVSQLDEALDALLKQYAFPTEERDLVFKAERQFLTGNYAQALPLYLKIFQSSPTARNGYRIYRCLVETGQQEKATGIILKYKNTDLLPILRELVELSAKNESVLSADDQIDILKRTASVEWKEELIKGYLLRLSDLYMKENRDLRSAYGALVELHNLNRKDQEVSTKIEDLESKFPFLKEEENPAERIINRGLKYLNDLRIEMRRIKNKGKLNQHIEELSSKLEYVPNHSEWLFELGVAFLENNDKEEAASLIKKSMQIDPEAYNLIELTEFISEIEQN